MSCVELSLEETLAGTAAAASRFLLLEHRGRWGRDAVEDTQLSGRMRSLAAGFDGRVLLLKRPDRRDDDEEVVYRAEATADGGVLHAVDGSGEEIDKISESILLVCVHGRRDRCCARLGVPLFDALARHVEPHRLWQSSHHGGHRFAANLLVLPHGIQLGRVPPREAAEVAANLADDRIPIAYYRGRTLDPPRVQVADAAVRGALELDRVEDVRPLRDDGRFVDVAVPDGLVRVRVDEVDGPHLPPSCGADPEPTRRFVAAVEATP